MIWSYLLNCGLGLVFLITYLFCITSVDDALNDASGYPFIFVFSQSVSPAGVKGLTFIVVILIFAGTLGFNLSTSRQTWSFARDRGLPFSSWIAHVDPKLHLPVNSVTLTCGITIALSLINLGSDVAFNAIISLNLVSLMITYTISIGCVLYRRIYHPELLPACRWSLGKWGVPINAISVVYSMFAFFWSFWPNAQPVDLEGFNWASVMFVGVFIISTIYYFAIARKHFKGPVVLVEGYRREE
jgi:choline transport protein